MVLLVFLREGLFFCIFFLGLGGALLTSVVRRCEVEEDEGEEARRDNGARRLGVFEFCPCATACCASRCCRGGCCLFLFLQWVEVGLFLGWQASSSSLLSLWRLERPGREASAGIERLEALEEVVDGEAEEDETPLR